MTVTFSAGDVTIHRIIEAEVPFAPIRTFLPTLSAELLDENRHWLEPHGGNPGSIEPGTDKLVLCFQSHVVRTPHHTVLIDSCLGNHKNITPTRFWHGKTDTRYMDGLAAVGLTVDDIDAVICTHLHADHIGWNTRLENGRWVPTFPNARYLFAKAELDYWTDRLRTAPNPALEESVLPIVAANRASLVGTEHVLDEYLSLFHTPGHTPAHCSVLVGRKNEAVMTGDAIHTPLQARYPELSIVADLDPSLAAQTRRAFLERFCDTETLCCTAHFPSPSTGRIVRWGDGFRCDPV